jgi:signal transduction histidine kinase
MSSRSRALFRSTTFRLTASYSLIFISSALILFLLAYSLLSDAVREGDRVSLIQKIREYASISLKKGPAGLVEFIQLERENYDYDEYYLRIDGVDGKPLLVLSPSDQPPLPDRLPTDPPGPATQWFFLPEAQGGSLIEMAGRALPGGGAVYMGKDASDRERLLRQFRVIFAGIMAPVALVGLTAGFILARRVLKPIQALIDTVRAIDTGRMDARVPGEGADDELNELARLFNAMLDKIKSLITGMREALDNVAHDLRTPATRTLAAVEMAAATKTEPEELREALLDCAEETRRMVSMLGILMDISEAETGAMRLRLGPTDMAALMEEAADLYQYVAEEKGVTLAVAPTDRLPVVADADRMRQVLANLLDNAIKYTPAGGHVEIAATRLGNTVSVCVADSGEGIVAEDIPRIFDRLYRADKSRSQRGLGLGLSLVRAVLYAHGGTIYVQSEPGAGSRFTFTLPAADPGRPSPA